MVKRYECITCGYMQGTDEMPKICPVCKTSTIWLEQYVPEDAPLKEVRQEAKPQVPVSEKEPITGDAPVTKTEPEEPDQRKENAKKSADAYKARIDALKTNLKTGFDRLKKRLTISKKWRNRILWTVSVIVILAGAAYGFYTYLVNQYEKANAMLDAGSYQEASAVFDQISWFRDSSDAGRYARACDTLEQGKYYDALNAFAELGNYKDSAAKKETSTNQLHEEELSDFTSKYDSFMTAVEKGSYKDALNLYPKLGDSLAVYHILRSEEVTDQVQETKYQYGRALSETKDYEAAVKVFKELGNYKDSESLRQTNYLKTDQGRYETALALKENGKYDEAIQAFSELESYSDSARQIQLCMILKGKETGDKSVLLDVNTKLLKEEDKKVYQEACYTVAEQLEKSKDYKNAFSLFKTSEWKDYKDRMTKCNKKYIALYRTLKLDGKKEVIKKVQYKKEKDTIHFTVTFKKTAGEIAKQFGKNAPFKVTAYSKEKKDDVDNLIYTYLKENDQKNTITFDVSYAKLKSYNKTFEFRIMAYYKDTKKSGANRYEADLIRFVLSDLDFKDLYGKAF